MYFARRQDQEREIPPISTRRDNGRQVELDFETRQTIHEVFKSLQSSFHSIWLQRHYNG